jgi:7,8-dihydropterin-6-yl-methyl-4-(beta-D-ribofuranosyl)aminobenzene 5'-phosphate synthase
MISRRTAWLVVSAVGAVAAVWWLAAAGPDGDRIPGTAGPGGPVPSRGAAEAEAQAMAPLPIDSLSIVITYDNYPYVEGLRTEWGFSCMVSGPGKTILFDTGGVGEVLLDNMRKLDLDPQDVDAIVLSHHHGDHTGGLGEFLRSNPDVEVYLLKSFDAALKRRAREARRDVIEVSGAVEVCPGVSTTGEMGFWIKEQGLIIETDAGLVVITGCAHPGVVDMVNRARELTGSDVLLVLGGFHLVRTGRDGIRDVIAGLKDAGVKFAAPCHCSGDTAREEFSRAFGRDYIRAGVGRSLTAADLNL